MGWGGHTALLRRPAPPRAPACSYMNPQYIHVRPTVMAKGYVATGAELVMVRPRGRAAGRPAKGHGAVAAAT